jgi:type IV pilus assembly protein PilC
MQFYYKARDKNGDMQMGEVDASSRESAFLVVQSYGLFVISLVEKKTPFYKQDFAIFDRVSPRDVVMISRQLAVMVESKIPIVESLQTLSRQIEQRNLKEKILNIANKIEGGMPLSKAFATYPEIFSEFYISMVKSGEASGKLSETLTYLADHLEREYEFRQKLVGAMFYPLFIMVIFLGIMIFLFVVIMPELTLILIDAGGEIPLVTQIVIGISGFLVQNGWFVILGVYSMIAFGLKYFSTKQGRDVLDEFILKLPVFKNFFSKVYIIRFAESLATLITAGLPIVRSLQITADIVQNKVYKEAILKVSESVEQGKQMSDGMKKYPHIFSPILLQMAIVGERSGRLGPALMNVVKFFRADLERTLEKYISMIEPLLIILLGGMVGGLVASVLLPIYNISMSVSS